jgi:hypothetical protein
MKIFKLAKEDNYNKMLEWFEKRTNKHIETVQKYCKKIEEYDDKFKGLIEQAKTHDQSKFRDPEVDPYVYITWKYKCKDNGVKFECPKEMENKMDEATEHHVLNNSHHPEFYCNRKTDLINKKDRDKPPSEIVDSTKMPNLAIGEMIADWMAVSEERGSNPKDWADKNVNIRWKFTDRQKNLIYKIINDIWRK